VKAPIAPANCPAPHAAIKVLRVGGEPHEAGGKHDEDAAQP
jgi:hypothetical protein